MKEVKIKPCPFCGKSRGSLALFSQDRWMVQCDYCCADGPVEMKQTKKQAIAAWNRRAKP